MIVHADALVTIALMALVTYATRALGFAALSGRTLGPRAKAVLAAAPPCVLLAVIAPAFVASRPADLLALAVTAIAAARLPMMATVAIAVAASATLRHAIG